MLLLKKICIHIKNRTHSHCTYYTRLVYAFQFFSTTNTTTPSSCCFYFVVFVFYRFCFDSHSLLHKALHVLDGYSSSLVCDVLFADCLCSFSLCFDIRSGFLSSRLLLLAVCRLYIYARVFSIALYGHERYKKKKQHAAVINFICNMFEKKGTYNTI